MKATDSAWPHGEIKQVFEDVFMVTGTNKTTHEGIEYEHSRNMTIVREKGALSLINTVRLTDQGLAQLETLGKVDKVVRIGAFHGRDDAFYLNKYRAKFWALPGMADPNGNKVDVEYTENGEQPLKNSSLIRFKTAQFPEGVIYLDREGGILISCDSIKNWEKADPYFSNETAKLYEEQGFFGQATIAKVWTEAMRVKASDFERILELPFRHLISAHGEPLLHRAYDAIEETVGKEFK